MHILNKLSLLLLITHLWPQAAVGARSLELGARSSELEAVPMSPCPRVSLSPCLPVPVLWCDGGCSPPPQQGHLAPCYCSTIPALVFGRFTLLTMDTTLTLLTTSAASPPPAQTVKRVWVAIFHETISNVYN